MSVDPATVEDGARFRVEWRVFSSTNAAVAPYYTTTIDMFAHTFEDTGERVLLVCAEWAEAADESEREYAHAYADGVPFDLDHPHLESVEPIDESEVSEA